MGTQSLVEGEGTSADSSIVIEQERLGQWEVEILQEVGCVSSEIHFLQLGSSSQRFHDLSRQWHQLESHCLNIWTNESSFITHTHMYL